MLGHMMVVALMASSVVTEDPNIDAGTGEKDTTVEKNDNSFFDLSTMEENEKRDLVKSIALLTDTDVDIDWVKLKKNYQLSVSMDFPQNTDEKDEDSISLETDETSNRRKLGLLSGIYREDHKLLKMNQQ